MSSSVLSEHAFSQGGITISKQRSHLKGDIVEALQCIKCAIWHNLLFQEPASSSKQERMLHNDSNDDTENPGSKGDSDNEESDINNISWKDILIEDEDDDDDIVYLSN